MERAVFETKLAKSKKNEVLSEETDRFNNLQKFQESLYKKFNNESLNKMRIPLPIKTGDHSETTLDAFTKTHTHLHSSSTQPDLRAFSTGETTSSNLKIAKIQTRRKKHEVRKFNVNGYTWTQIPSDKWKLADKKEYGDETNPEAKIAELQLNEDEERHYIQNLNRNIKIKRPVSMSNAGTRRFTQDFTDIDTYLKRKVEAKIENDELAKEKPLEFKKYLLFQCFRCSQNL